MEDQTTTVIAAEPHNETVAQRPQTSALSELPLLPVPASQSIDLPLYREMAGVCDQSEPVSAIELRQLRKLLLLGRLRDDHFQTSFERNTYAQLSCRYCDRNFGTQVTAKGLAAHAVKVRHFKNVYAMGRTVPRKDFEFWRDIINRAEQVRLEEVKKSTANAEQNWESTVVPKCYHVPEITVPPKKFFYRDKKGDMQGPISEEQMQEWYRKGYFNSNILIGIGQKEQLVPFSDLLAENGNSTAFAFVEKTRKISESHPVLTYRPWYLIPMLHPIAVPSLILLSGEKLVDEMEKLREKLCLRNEESLDAVLSHLLTTSMNCELCSTAVFVYSSEFVAHLFSRQHHEELYENLSGVTKNDIDYWDYVLDQARPSDGPNKVHEKLLLKGRFRDEDGKLLYRQDMTNVPIPRSGPQASVQKPTSAVQPVQTWRSSENATGPFQNVRSEDRGIPSEEPKDFVQKPTSTVHLDLKMSSLDAKPMNTMSTAFAGHVLPSSQAPKQGKKTKTTVLKKPSKKQKGGKAKNMVTKKKTYKKEDPTATKAQNTAKWPPVPTSCMFFKLKNTGTCLSISPWGSFSCELSLRKVPYTGQLHSHLHTHLCRKGKLSRLHMHNKGVYANDYENDLSTVPSVRKAHRKNFAATECFRCPFCTVQIQHGRPFADHTLGRRHIEKLYSQNGAITQEDVDVYREILREQINRN